MTKLCFDITCKLETQKEEFSNQVMWGIAISSLVLSGGLALSSINLSSNMKAAGKVAAVAGALGEACIKRYRTISHQLNNLSVKLSEVQPDIDENMKDYKEMNSEIRKKLETIICNCKTECTKLVELFK
ncbi:9617_t:CDS:2 [Cetraspora pellucida]|uniref:9617_t:CDS:1 n=1 Tax=Cetraspora pellucida TaxID=1433469 RepID=A0A9N9N7Y2_9GLOM|nr:9617_t:CDS:2 [Cetraspora pellucida]